METLEDTPLSKLSPFLDRKKSFLAKQNLEQWKKSETAIYLWKKIIK